MPHHLERYVLATDSWKVIFRGNFSECEQCQRATSGYTRIVRAPKR